MDNIQKITEQFITLTQECKDFLIQNGIEDPNLDSIADHMAVFVRSPKMTKDAHGQVLRVFLEVYLDIDRMKLQPKAKWAALGDVLKNLLKKYQDTEPKPIPDEG